MPGLLKSVTLHEGLPDCRVLPVDNANANLDILVLSLKADHKISRSMSGEIALQMAARTPPDREKQLTPVLNRPVRDIVLDLAQLKFSGSAGLRVFSSIRKTLKSPNGQSSFLSTQPQVRELFEIKKALPGVAGFKDVAELDHYLAVRRCSHQEK